jgi:hypothetical protein
MFTSTYTEVRFWYYTKDVGVVEQIPVEKISFGGEKYELEVRFVA